METNHLRVSLACTPLEKLSFSEQKVALAVSVGQAAHEHERFVATIQLIEKRFKSFDLIVCDSLQRHTLSLTVKTSPEELYAYANRLGEEWMIRNKKYIDNCKNMNAIFRWDDYIINDAFQETLDRIHGEYLNNITFKNAMDRTIEKFLERYLARHPDIDVNETRQVCFNYLAEEVGISMIMWQEKQYSYIVYPAPILDVMFEGWKIFVEPKNPNMLKWLKVYVRTKETYKRSRIAVDA